MSVPTFQVLVPTLQESVPTFKASPRTLQESLPTLQENSTHKHPSSLKPNLPQNETHFLSVVTHTLTDSNHPLYPLDFINSVEEGTELAYALANQVLSTVSGRLRSPFNWKIYNNLPNQSLI